MSGSGHGETYDMIKVYSGLLRSDEKMQMVPDLAESWAVGDNWGDIDMLQ